MSDPPDEFVVAGWSVRPDLNRISRQGEAIHLEPRVMDLLVYLAERGGEVLSRDQIINDVWPAPHVGDDALLTAVSALRKAFGDDPRKPLVIETIPKRGYRLIAPTSARPRATIAVLPLQNFSPEADEGYFADAMTEALITELGTISTLRVISRHSIMGYRNTHKTVAEIAGELGARFLVEGSVTRAANRVRITSRLVEAVRDRQLLAASYEGELANVFEVQREAATTIARAISSGVESTKTRLPARTVHPDALIAYQRGRFHWWKMSPEHFERALDYFRQAVETDPGYGAAHAGIADVWGALGYWGSRRPSEVRENVFDAASRAVEVDPANPEVHMLMGNYLFYFRRDWSAAEEAFRRAIELNPSFGHARLLYALFLGTMGRREALDEIGLAVRLDPLNPGPFLVRALCLAVQGGYDAARRDVDYLLELDPQHPPGLMLRADLDWAEGAPDPLQGERRVWVNDAEVSAAFVVGSTRNSPAERMRAVAQVLSARSRTTYVSPMQLSRVLMHAGDEADAIDLLEQAAHQGDLMQIDFLEMSPVWDPLRRTPRFVALEKQLGLPT